MLVNGINHPTNHDVRLIGLSLPLNLREMLEFNISPDRVERIISNTAINFNDSKAAREKIKAYYFQIMVRYRLDQVERIIYQLLKDDKIEQPRLSKDGHAAGWYYHSIPHGIWLNAASGYNLVVEADGTKWFSGTYVQIRPGSAT